MAQEGAREIEPWAVRVVEGYGWHTEGREGDASNDSIPIEADPEKALEWARSTQVFDDCQNMHDPLFEVDVAPSEAPEPERAEDDRPTHFPA